MSNSNRTDRRGGLGGRGLGGGLIGNRTSPITKIVQGVASGIGFVSESYHHNKEKKQAKKAQEQVEGAQEARGLPEEPAELDATYAASAEQVDEVAWQLDEAQDAAAPVASFSDSNPQPSEPDFYDVAESFAANHPPPAYTPFDGQAVASPPRLSLPVVLTQRRPKDRKRGFVRAYAPVLNEVGIDQAAFLDFLDQLTKAVEPSPWLNAINLASFAGMHVPEPFTIIISAAVAAVTEAALEGHSRSKTNLFLDRVNDSFFRPRGLICLVMTWQPQTEETGRDAAKMVTTVDFQGHVVASPEASSTQRGAFNKVRHNLQSSSGVDAFEWPETAPLIFLVLDDMATTDGADENKKKKENAVRRGGNFVGEYMDRRAQAKWAGENADSQMANSVPKPKFHSRYADPNHPASSGDPLALLTGGHLQISTLRGAVTGQAESPLQRITAERMRSVRDIQNRRQLGGDVGGNLIKGAAKMMQKVSRRP
jgi:hypothetical protein